MNITILFMGQFRNRIIFLSNAVLSFSKPIPVRIFEVGFGTGLNALLTFISIYAQDKEDIIYTAIEKYPLP